LLLYVNLNTISDFLGGEHHQPRFKVLKILTVFAHLHFALV